MRKKMIAPILFAFLTIVFILGYAAIFLYLPIPMAFKVVVALVVLSLVVTLGYLLMQRNKELEEEEKDDLGKY